jgi:hypothetical protein
MRQQQQLELDVERQYRRQFVEFDLDTGIYFR